VWMDPCHTIIPGRPKTEFDQKMAGYGKSSRWMSGDARDDSRNLRSGPYTNKTLQWGDKRVWWYIFLTQGKVHVEVLPEGWSQWDGQAVVVAMLPGIFKKMLGRGCDIPRSRFYRQGPWILPPFFWNHKRRVSGFADGERHHSLGRRAQQVATARLARCSGRHLFNMVLTLREPVPLLERRRRAKHVRPQHTKFGRVPRSIPGYTQVCARQISFSNGV